MIKARINLLIMRQTTIVSILIIVFSVCLYAGGCRQKEKDALKITVDFNNAAELFSSGIIESIRIIELETTRESLVGNIGKIYLSDDDIFVQSNPKPQSTQNTLLRFGMDGKFHNPVGNRGEGPGEFNNLVDFHYNRESAKIELLVPHNRLLVFDKHGVFSGQAENPHNVPANSFVKTSEGNYFLYGGANNGFDNYRLYLVSPDGEIIRRFLGQPTNLSALKENNFTLSGNNVYFREAFNDTIYLLSGEYFEPCYIFDFLDYSLPKGFYQYPRESLFTNITKFAIPFSFHDNRDYMLTSFLVFGHESPLFFLLKSKRTNQTILIRMPEQTEYIESFKGPGYLTSKNEIIFLLHPTDLLKNAEKIKKIPLFDEVAARTKSTDENSNPFLVLAKIKDF
jgi:hypothetical protein